MAGEVEQINEDIANHMYKAEFMMEKSQSEVSVVAAEPTSPPVTQQREKIRTPPLISAGIEGVVREKVEKVVGENAEKIFHHDQLLFDGADLTGAGDHMVGAGDHVALNLEKFSPGRDSPVDRTGDSGGSVYSPARSPLRSPVRTPSLGRASPSTSGRPSPNGSAREPLLDDVTQFVSRDREERDSEESRGEEERQISDVDYSEDKEFTEQDDEEDYSDEDFEDVSDVEMP